MRESLNRVDVRGPDVAPKPVDEVDLKLIRAMGINPFLHGVRGPDSLKPSTLAKAVGLTAESVRERIARLEASGVIVGYQVYPNYRHLGRTITSYMWRVPAKARKGSAMSDAGDVEGVVCVMGFVGAEACTDIVHRGPEDLKRRVRLLSKLLGDADPFAYQEYKLPTPGGEMTRLDWRIVERMRGNARRAPEVIAKELRISGRTVKRHVAAMFARGSIDVVPAVWPNRLSGVVPFILHVELEAGATDDERAQIAKAVDDHWFHQYSPPDAERRCMDFMMAAPSMGDAEEIRLQTESLSGVESVLVLVPNSMRGTEAWLDEEIERLAGIVKPAPAPTPTPAPTKPERTREAPSVRARI